MPTHRESTRLASLSYLGTKAHFITICCNHRLPHLKACKTAQRGDLHSPRRVSVSRFADDYMDNRAERGPGAAPCGFQGADFLLRASLRGNSVLTMSDTFSILTSCQPAPPAPSNSTFALPPRPNPRSARPPPLPTAPSAISSSKAHSPAPAKPLPTAGSSPLPLRNGNNSSPPSTLLLVPSPVCAGS